LKVNKLSRPQTVKHLWDYIKGNSLQKPEDKRVIMCDPALRAIFKVDSIDMFTMNKAIGVCVSHYFGPMPRILTFPLP